MNNITPDLVHRTRHEEEVEDLALLFMEEEVGRFDWQANWKKVKETGRAREKVKAWLDDVYSDHAYDPDAIVACLDKVAEDRSGRWL